jgi:hypothetical protein
MRMVLVQGHSYRIRIQQIWRLLRKTNPICRRGDLIPRHINDREANRYGRTQKNSSNLMLSYALLFNAVQQGSE